MSEMFGHSTLTPRKLSIPEALADDPVFGSPLAPNGSAFVNPWDPMEPPKPTALLKWKGAKNPFAPEKRRPLEPKAASAPVEAFLDNSFQAKALFNGHATFMTELDGVRLLIDPVFGPAAVVPRKRPSPLNVATMPRPHAVLLTHGHYDHFEAKTLKQLADKFGPDLWFIVPKGLGRYLPAQCRKVVELSWWEQVELGPLTITFTPSQHWHRRGLRDYNHALWGGWFISGSQKLYHIGDSGYFGGFKVVRQVLGEPDVALLPLGAWEPRWFMGYQHMSPEDALQTWQDLGAKRFVAMHWGVFDLADEPVDLGPDYFRELLQRQENKEALARFYALRLGETIGFSEDETSLEPFIG